MEFRLFPILSLIVVVHAASSDAYSPEKYWKSELPNTPMPQAIWDIVHPTDLVDGKGTAVDVGKGGVDVDTGTGQQPGGGTQVDVGKGGVGVETGKPDKRTSVGVGKGGVGVSTHGKGGKPVYVGVQPGPNPFQYLYAASETQVRADPNLAKFFLEKDLTKGKIMSLYFPKSTNKAAFLPRQVARSMPFSSKNLHEAMTRLSVKPGSVEAEQMTITVKECEEPEIKGEEKYCATSLESMVDYTKAKLGKNAHAISTEVNKESAMQRYKIHEYAKKVTSQGSKYVVCHKQKYPYAVFYCHKTDNTKVYKVPLKGRDGSEVKAVAVCHTDTSQWNPKHLAFQVLGVEPGSIPICHFLPQDHIVWYSN